MSDIKLVRSFISGLISKDSDKKITPDEARAILRTRYPSGIDPKIIAKDKIIGSIVAGDNVDSFIEASDNDDFKTSVKSIYDAINEEISKPKSPASPSASTTPSASPSTSSPSSVIIPKFNDKLQDAGVVPSEIANYINDPASHSPKTEDVGPPNKVIVTFGLKAFKLDDSRDFSIFVGKDNRLHFLSWVRDPEVKPDGTPGDRQLEEIAIPIDAIKLKDLNGTELQVVTENSAKHIAFSKHRDSRDFNAIGNGIPLEKELEDFNTGDRKVALYLSDNIQNGRESKSWLMGDKTSKYALDDGRDKFTKLFFEKYIKGGELFRLKDTTALISGSSFSTRSRFATTPSSLSSAKFSDFKPFSIELPSSEQLNELKIGIDWAKSGNATSSDPFIMTVNGQKKVAVLNEYKGGTTNKDYIAIHLIQKNSDGTFEVQEIRFEKEHLVKLLWDKFKIKADGLGINELRNLISQYLRLEDKEMPDNKLWDLKQKLDRPTIFAGEIKDGSVLVHKGKTEEELKDAYHTHTASTDPAIQARRTAARSRYTNKGSINTNFSDGNFKFGFRELPLSERDRTGFNNHLVSVLSDDLKGIDRIPIIPTKNSAGKIIPAKIVIGPKFTTLLVSNDPGTAGDVINEFVYNTAELLATISRDSGIDFTPLKDPNYTGPLTKTLAEYLTIKIDNDQNAVRNLSSGVYYERSRDSFEKLTGKERVDDKDTRFYTKFTHPSNTSGTQAKEEEIGRKNDK